MKRYFLVIEAHDLNMTILRAPPEEVDGEEKKSSRLIDKLNEPPVAEPEQPVPTDKISALARCERVVRAIEASNMNELDKRDAIRIIRGVDRFLR